MTLVTLTLYLLTRTLTAIGTLILCAVTDVNIGTLCLLLTNDHLVHSEQNELCYFFFNFIYFYEQAQAQAQNIDHFFYHMSTTTDDGTVTEEEEG